MISRENARELAPHENMATGKSDQTGQPRFGDLSRDECEQLLARNHMGRIAFTLHDRVDIAPIHYVYAYGWIYGRTSHGAKLTTLAHQRWVAFEVDEGEGLFDWRSVVVKGSFNVLETGTATAENAELSHGVSLLRTLIPETLTGSDPVPFRQTVFRIHLDEVTGREARSQKSDR